MATNNNSPDIGASFSGPSTSAYVETGRNNSVGVNATLARAEAHAGPLGVGVGLNLDTGLDEIFFDLWGIFINLTWKIKIETWNNVIRVL